MLGIAPGAKRRGHVLIAEITLCDRLYALIEHYLRPHRLAWSRTPAFHAGNSGSNPLGDAIIYKGLEAHRLLSPFFIGICNHIILKTSDI